MKIKSFSPVTDWFFCHKKADGKSMNNYPLAGWAVIEEGEHDVVVGMVAVEGGGNSPVMPGKCRLTTVPPVEGTYKHISEIPEMGGVSSGE